MLANFTKEVESLLCFSFAMNPVPGAAVPGRLGRCLRLFFNVLAVVICFLWLIASRDDLLKAEVWIPPSPLPVLEKNEILATKAERLLEGKLLGPESLAFKGNDLYTGLMDGRIVRINTKTWEIHEFARLNPKCEPFNGGYDSYPPQMEPICGRPLGLRFDKEGWLVVAESYHGIHRISPDGNTREVLVDNVEGRKITFVNDLDVASDGTIYFSETSDRWGRNRVIHEILASRPVGTLVSFHPSDPAGTMKVYKGFLPCNGVSLSHDEKFVYFVSSTRIYRLDRNSEDVSVALDNAPGVMDNIRRRKGAPNRFLVGCASKRSQPFALPDLLAPYPKIRNLLAYLFPPWLLLKIIPRMGLLLEVDLTQGEERFVRSFQDRRSDGIAYVSEAEELSDGYTYMGTWHESHLVRAKTSELLD